MQPVLWQSSKGEHISSRGHCLTPDTVPQGDSLVEGGRCPGLWALERAPAFSSVWRGAGLLTLNSAPFPSECELLGSESGFSTQSVYPHLET